MEELKKEIRMIFKEADTIDWEGSKYNYAKKHILKLIEPKSKTLKKGKEEK